MKLLGFGKAVRVMQERNATVDTRHIEEAPHHQANDHTTIVTPAAKPDQ